MIAETELFTLAKKYQTTELNVRREYFQHEFLSCFYKQDGTDKIYFKGGTALRILYNSPRFSEDLDFSSSISGVHTIEEIVLNTLIELKRGNLDVALKESKQTSGGYLAIINEITLEISLREKKTQGEVETVISDFIPPYTLMSLKKNYLIAEKIQALLTRGKARDYYDLYFILRGNLLPTREKRILSKVMETLKKTRIDFDKELKQFLPRSHHPIIRNFRQALEREMGKYI